MLTLLNVTSLSLGDPPRFSGNFFASYCLVEKLATMEGIELHVATDGNTHDRFLNLLPSSRCHLVAPAIEREGLRSIVQRDYALKRLVDKLRPRVFHRTTGQLPIFKLNNCAAVTTIADLNFKFSSNIGLAQRIYKELSFRLTFKRSVRVAAVSQYSADQVTKFYSFPAERITVTHHGVIARPKGNFPFDLVGTNPFYLTLAHFPHKNCEAAILALNQLRLNGGEERQLVIVGDNAYVEQRLKPLVKQLELESKVRFVGYVRDDELGSLYAYAKALLFLSKMEGFGLPLVEAFHAGCPVIAANTTSIPEVVGDAGILVEPDDIKGVVSAIEKIESDFSFRAKQIELGKSRTKLFDWNEVAKKTCAVYEMACKDFFGQE